MSASLIDQMRMIYEGNNWHASVRDLLRSVTAEQAAWRPEQGGHTIHEIVAHVTYSASIVAARLREGEAVWDEALGWIMTPSTFTNNDWEAAISSYEDARNDLASAIAAMSHEQLAADRGKGRGTYNDMAQQVIHHEAFHAGQIAMLRRLQQQTALL